MNVQQAVSSASTSPALSRESAGRGGKASLWRGARGQVFMAVAVLGAGLAMTGGVTMHLYRRAARDAQRAFQQESVRYRDRTLGEIQRFMEVLDSIRQLHGVSDQVSTTAFEEIVQKGMLYQQRILGAYGFAQYLPQADRAAVENQRQPLVESDGKGGFQPASDRVGYFPLTYQTPAGGLGVPTGYDFGSEPESQGALAEMFRHGIFTVAGTASADEYRVFAPTLYLTSEGQITPSGFAVTLFRPNRVLTAAGEGLLGLTGRLVAPSDGIATNDATTPNTENKQWMFSSEFSMGHQEWKFVTEGHAEYWMGERPRTPATAGILGGTLTLVLFFWLLGLARQTGRVEQLVQHRTAQLGEANRKLEGLMEERRQLEEAVLRTGREERTRVGRDLHDSLGQKLTGVLYLFSAWRQRHAMEPTTHTDAQEAAQIAKTLKEAVTQVCRIARGLAPVALTEDGLPDALRTLAEETAMLYHLPVDFFYEREGRPRDATAAEHLYLIAQEAVTNAAKHAGGSRIVLTLDYRNSTGNNGLLCIEDDGCGFGGAPGPDAVGGNGLRIMRHRADILNGTLRVESVEGERGTKIVVEFPSAQA